MFFIENIRLAFSSLKSNKMRAMLTMLGIIIGISAVITITTLGNSLKKTLSNSFNQIGENYFSVEYIFQGGKDDEGNYLQYRPMQEEDYITQEMYDELEEKYPGKYLWSRSCSCGSGNVINPKSQKLNISVQGVTEGNIRGGSLYKVIDGRCIKDADDKGKKHSALVSDIFVKQYFGSENAKALGKDITVDIDGICSTEFTIVGVYKFPKIMEKYFQPGISMMDRTTPILIPYETGLKLTNAEMQSNYEEVTLSSATYDRKQAKEELLQFFDEKYSTNRYYKIYIYDPMEDMEDITKVLNVVTIVVAIIAAISLLVGGIGVMNIMLVSITERTREIGVRKALGAKNSSIRTQFITEAVILCLIGGIIGVLLGIFNGFLIGEIAKYAMTQMPEYQDIISLTIQPSPAAMLISLGFSMLIGIFFGSYPAGKAAKLDPIEALRYE
ncbi:MAG: ABC transporter permease [Ruminococcus sp.]|nr:ABC transporter permease [Ruminococcus sp.]